MPSAPPRRPIDDVAVLAGATVTQKLNVSQIDYMHVFWTITDAAAGGDLVTVSVTPYTAWEDSVPGLHALASTLSGGTIFSTPVASQHRFYDVRGLHFVDLALTNSAGATRQATVHVLGGSDSASY